MAESPTIRVQARAVTGKHVRRLRAQGLIPANISGGGKPSSAIQIPTAELTHLLNERHTSVLKIRVGSARGENVLLGRVERDAITGTVLHVDFRRVRMDQPVRAKVAVHLIGEAPAIKLHGGVLLHLLDTVEIESLPADIPEAVTLDISPLDELNSLLTVADIQSPPDIAVLSAATEPVVTIKAPRIEIPEVEAVAPAAPVPAEPVSGGESEGSESS
jgi:large subunit ribosomal protein L25